MPTASSWFSPSRYFYVEASKNFPPALTDIHESTRTRSETHRSTWVAALVLSNQISLSGNLAKYEMLLDYCPHWITEQPASEQICNQNKQRSKWKYRTNPCRGTHTSDTPFGYNLPYTHFTTAPICLNLVAVTQNFITWSEDPCQKNIRQHAYKKLKKWTI